MRPLPADFAPARNVSPHVWLGWLLLLGLVLFALLHDALGVAERRQAANAEYSALHGQLQRLSEAQRDAAPDVPEPYARDAADLAALASFPTAAVFAALERTQVPQVRVVQLEVNASARTARIEIEFANSGALHQYLQDINLGESVGRWTLAQTQAQAAPNWSTATLASTWPASPVLDGGALAARSTGKKN